VFDGAIVSTTDGTKPCQPVARAVTTAEEAIRSASSWYTYCPNNLALREAADKNLTRVAFVGVPCQITPNRKMELADPSFLDNGRKKEKHLERQRSFLKGFGERIALNIGLLCSEVFTFGELMVDTIEGCMGIPLADIKKFNVKGKILIDKKNGERVEMNLREAQEYARPECHHCGDFSAELADISCGGVGANDWTITVLRTEKGVKVFDSLVAEGLVEVRPMEEFESSVKVFLRLARKQRVRVPVPPGRTETWVRPPGFANI
jgi:coenzyme F420 hydrogenase subunit beta